MKLSQAIEQFYSVYSLQFTQGTAVNYRQNLDYLTVIIGDLDLKSITLAHLQAFMVHLRDEATSRRPQEKPGHPLAPATIDNYWKSIRAFFRWANEDLDLPRPDLKLSRPHYLAPEVSPFSVDEIRRMIEACEYTVESAGRRKPFKMRRPTARRDLAIIMVLLDTGVRLGELLRMTIADLDLAAGEITVVPYGSGRKTKPRVIPIGRNAQRAIQRWLATRGDYDKEDDLFPGKQTIVGIIRRLGERLGFHVHPHRFRHTFAIMYLRNGGDIYTLRRILGHSSLKMVEHYLAITSSDVKGTHTRASPVDNLSPRPFKRNTR